MLKRIRRLRASNISVTALMVMEFAAIVAAIVLGFMVNEWREDRQRERTLDTALSSLAQEMSFNHDRLVATWEYYFDIFGRIRERMAEEEELTDGEREAVFGYHLEGWRGAMPSILRSSTFRMLVSTGIIADLPFEQADRLALVYRIQEVLERMDDGVILRFTQDPEYTRIDNVGHIFGIYLEIIPMVLAMYEMHGRELLIEHGYTARVENERLREQMQMQLGDLPD